MRSKTSILKSQIVTSSSQHGGRRKLTFVFTEQGVSMLSAVLRSNIAIEVSIHIINAFVDMRKMIMKNGGIFLRMNNLEQSQINIINKQNETDQKINQILDAIEEKDVKPKQGIFYDGQVFDAYLFVCDLIKTAKKSITLIDNYVDESVLELFAKRLKNVKVTIYTRDITKIVKQDLRKFNAQYQNIEIKELHQAHDRFIIIDHKHLYHIGASLKDLGKKWFAFSKLDISTIEILNKLEQT